MREKTVESKRSRISLSSVFVIKKRSGDSEAIVFSRKQKVAKIRKNQDFSFKLIQSEDMQEWVLSNIVDGQRRPFSYAVRETRKNHSNNEGINPNVGKEIFVVREQLFKHNGKFYMLASHPEGKSWMDYVNSSIRYITRLDNFPFSSLSDVDHDHYKLRHKIETSWYCSR